MRVAPAGRLAGSLTPPPDKSISHRALLLAAMSDGESRLHNVLRAADTDSTLAAVRALGAELHANEPRGAGADLAIGGVGLRGVHQAARPLDVGNAGTLMRLLPGWLAGQSDGRWQIDGDESIRRRPVDRVVEPLREMGASISCRDGRLPPLEVEGSPLRGIAYELPVASAQVKSCVLLAGLLADGETTVVEPLPARDHTERMLASAGASIRVEDGTVTVSRADSLVLGEAAVPGDFSSAAFFIAAATIVPGSEVVLEEVGVNSTRTGLLDVMERMGAGIEVGEERMSGGEPLARLAVRASALRGTTVGAREVPLLIDELPLVALLGAFAEGTTEVSGAEELRHKESDRIATVVAALRALGASIEATDDGFVVQGLGGLRGGAIDAAGDHRLAMLGAVAGLASREGVGVEGFEISSVSYPRFADDLARVAG